MVSRAILEYMSEHHLSVHAPHESSEVSGQGITFSHDNQKMFIGRLSFLETQKVHMDQTVTKDIAIEKDAGRGVVVLAIDGEIAGLLSYRDEIRPRVKEIITETKELGVLEWHMLTGDNERAAAPVVRELGIDDFHANMTPETKVAFIKSFQEKPKGDGGWINGGFFVLSPKCINFIESDETVWEQAPLKNIALKGELMAYEHKDFWQPMDTLREKNLLEELWEANKAPWTIW